jgi:hypothetical protein
MALPIIMAIVALFLIISDEVTTYHAIKHGYGRESNRFIAWYMSNFGTLAGLAVSAVALIIGYHFTIRLVLETPWGLAWAIPLYLYHGYRVYINYKIWHRHEKI